LSTAVEFAGDTPVARTVQRIIAIQEIKGHPPNGHLPDPKTYQTSRKIKRHTKPGAGVRDHRLDGQTGRIIVGIKSLLLAIGIEHLPEVPFLEQQADTDHRHSQVAGRLEVVPGKDSEPPSIERK